MLSNHEDLRMKTNMQQMRKGDKGIAGINEFPHKRQQ